MGRITSRLRIAIFVHTPAYVHFFAELTATMFPIARTQHVLSRASELEVVSHLRLHRGLFEQNGDEAAYVCLPMLSSELISSLGESTPSPQSAQDPIPRHFSMHVGLRQPRFPCAMTIPLRSDSSSVHPSSRVDFRTPRMKPFFCPPAPVAIVLAAFTQSTTLCLGLWRSYLWRVCRP